MPVMLTRPQGTRPRGKAKALGGKAMAKNFGLKANTKANCLTSLHHTQ